MIQIEAECQNKTEPFFSPTDFDACELGDHMANNTNTLKSTHCNLTL